MATSIYQISELTFEEMFALHDCFAKQIVVLPLQRCPAQASPPDSLRILLAVRRLARGLFPRWRSTSTNTRSAARYSSKSRAR